LWKDWNKKIKMINGLGFLKKGKTAQNMEKVKKEGSIYKCMKLRGALYDKRKYENTNSSSSSSSSSNTLSFFLLP